MRTILLLTLLHFSFLLSAQNRCITQSDLSAGQPFATPAGVLDYRPALPGQRDKQGSRDPLLDAVIRIPVVVHVLYSNAAQNISDAQIKSGIDALNRDFRRQNADTLNTPERFRGIAADVQIEFYLATADPQGRPTNGILRKPSPRNLWMPDDKMKSSATGGSDGWDSKSYLNFWIVDLAGGSGYASLPGSAAQTDGVVIDYAAFGTLQTAAPFNMGRTAVHEVGHWLGLKHIWGDAQCGDDGVDDTPPQGFFTQGCPSGFRSSCNNGEQGDMYMNYMDYTNDACMNLFTLGQRQRMRSQFAAGGPRASLLQSKGLETPARMESPLPDITLPAATAVLFPNPAHDKLTVQFSSQAVGKTVRIFGSQGQLQKTELIQSVQQTISVSGLQPGVYFLQSEGQTLKFNKL